MATKPSIIVSHISHLFRSETGDHIHVLNDVSFDVAPGEFVTIIGPSGSGKSVFLQILAGFLRPTKGSIQLSSSRTAMIFQNYALFPWLTVGENIGFGVVMSGASKQEKSRIVREKVGEMGLKEFEDKYPKELSGGMKQRVGIGRALAIRPDILLMDEPFSNLDAFTAEKLRVEVVELWQKYKITTVMVTHLIDDAVEMSNRIVVFSKRPAHVKAIHDIPLAFPRDKRSKEFYALVDAIHAEIE